MAQNRPLIVAFWRHGKRYISPHPFNPFRGAGGQPGTRNRGVNVPNGQLYWCGRGEGRNCPRQTLNIIFDLKVAAAAAAPIPCFVITLKNVPTFDLWEHN